MPMMNHLGVQKSGEVLLSRETLGKGDFKASLNAKTKESLSILQLVDNAAVADGTQLWDLSYGVGTSLQYDILKLDFTFEQVYNSAALQTYKIAGSFSLEKRFGLFSIGSVLNGEYSGDAITPTNDALAIGLTVSGGISL